MPSLNVSFNRYLFIFVLLVLFSILFFFSEKNKQISTMTITSFGELTVLPNEVILSFSLESSSNDYNKVVDLDINSYNSILNSLVNGLKVHEKDIKTISYSLNPRYSYVDGIRIFEGFSLYHSYELAILYDTKNFHNLVKVLQTIKIENDTKFNFSLNFSNNELEKYENEAYEAAIRLTEKKAESIAHSSGVSITRKLNILPLENQENIYASPRMSLSSAVPSYQNFTPSEIKISKGIQIVFEIK